MKLTIYDIKKLQETYKEAGIDPGPIDGIWGPRTEAGSNAYAAKQASVKVEELRGLPTFDARTERNILTLLWEAQLMARKFLGEVRKAGINAQIISGSRSWAEQDDLYAQGRTRDGNIVTNAKGGYSNHNFSVAWDIGIFDNGKYLGESPLYARAGKIGRDMGLEWGGGWATFVDEAHFQLQTGLTTAQMRNRVLKGEPII